ncbi:MAG TPA: hypothetical protein DEB09_05185 [Candidatus Magasanikbacteria bacterium]|nr:hypothetical protein [Candidatus Magasanikbacteria bacterium]
MFPILLSRPKIFIITSITAILSILCIFNFLPNWLGTILLLFLIFVAGQLISQIWPVYRINNKYWILLFYTIISLTGFYYIFGVTKLIISLWLIITILLLNILNKKILTITLPKIDKPNLFELFIIFINTILLVYFFLKPIYSGLPSPWTNIHPIIFLLFFINLILIIWSLINQQKISKLTTFFFLASILGIITARYSLSFGYDTLLHQTSLNYIANNGNITPLTPFYIGQYVLEILVHYFTNLSFTTIERFFLPLFSIISLTYLGQYFFEKLKLKNQIIIIPLSILLLIPNQFTFTSPYSFALLLALVSLINNYLFIKLNQNNYWVLALCASIVSILVHPFIGLHILVITLGNWFYQKTIYKKTTITLTTISSSIAVVFSFSFYNWFIGKDITIADPLFYIYKFFGLFSDPIWYFSYYAQWWWKLIYNYEKFYVLIILVILMIYFFRNKQRTIESKFIFLAFGTALVSAWFFVSLIEVDQFTFGDHFNYSYRLFHYSKWLLWPLLIIFLNNIFVNIKQKPIWQKIILIFLLSGLGLTSWYFTYPRSDQISRPNINNIRSVDYKAIETIHDLEKDKQGYLVFANQLLGAGAMKTYGFGPYYTSPWGLLNYYSVPMASELNIRYEQIMNGEEFRYDLIKDTMEQMNINRAYLVITDYWPMYPISALQAKEMSNGFWNIDNQIFIYRFDK